MTFVPQPEHINIKARAGSFYARPSTSLAVTIARVAQVAAKYTTGITTANMVKAIADSAWNQAHFTYSTTGVQNYTNYGFAGPQYAKSGGQFPLLWIPTADGLEPEEVFGVAVVGGRTPAPTPRTAVELPAQPPATMMAQPGVRDGYTSDGRAAGPGITPGGKAATPLGIALSKVPWGWVLAGVGVLTAAGVYLWKRSKKRRR